MKFVCVIKFSFLVPLVLLIMNPHIEDENSVLDSTNLCPAELVAQNAKLREELLAVKSKVLQIAIESVISNLKWGQTNISPECVDRHLSTASQVFDLNDSSLTVNFLEF